jgi:nicotinamide mononucleotide transporter
MKKYLFPILATLGSLLLIAISYFGLAPMSLVEVFGFISGAVCVWLVAKDNIWNWPIGIVNAAFYIVVFFQAKLFADMSLQVLYVILGFLGWFMWLKGGENKSKLNIRRIGSWESLGLLVIALVSTYFMHGYLVTIGDSAPFLDALTTVVSLVAQYMLTKKFIENWYLWLAVDVVYVGLYFSRGLYLTAVLYAIFFTMCLVGLREWSAKRVSHIALAERGSDV